jgi:hypothetical protein
VGVVEHDPDPEVRQPPVPRRRQRPRERLGRRVLGSGGDLQRRAQVTGGAGERAEGAGM